MRFWDASAAVPLCLDQPRTSMTKALMEEDPFLVVWWGTLVECHSAFGRLRRKGHLDAAQESETATSLRDLSDAWTEVLPSQELRRLALALVHRYPLRAADAFQLAAAHFWTGERPQGQPFVSLDRRLREAALQEGFSVLPESILVV